MRPWRAQQGFFGVPDLAPPAYVVMNPPQVVVEVDGNDVDIQNFDSEDRAGSSFDELVSLADQRGGGRQSNPLWLIAAGAALVAGGASYLYCRSRVMMTESSAMDGIEVSKTITYNGCFAEAATAAKKYTVRLTFGNVTTQEDFPDLDQAKEFYGKLDVRNPLAASSDRMQSNPNLQERLTPSLVRTLVQDHGRAVGDFRGQARAWAKRAQDEIERSFDAGWNDAARGMYRPRGLPRFYDAGARSGISSWAALG